MTHLKGSEHRREISSMMSVLQQAVQAGLAFGSEVWWRGHADSRWPLTPGVFRGSRNALYEQNISVRFLRAAPTRHPRCPAREDLAGWLQLMQHYRLPTRLLDWSQSPLIALYFAVSEMRDTDGAIWALSPYLLNEATGRERMVLNTDDPRIQALMTPAFNMKFRGPEEVLAMYGDELDLRMALQLAAFTIHGSGVPLEQHPQADRFLRKIDVTASAKKDLSEALWILGIRRSNLFPDLDNLSRELAELEFQG